MQTMARSVSSVDADPPFIDVPIMPFPTPSHFNLSFTAASLRPELAWIIADYYLNAGDWVTAKKKVLAANALQCRSPASSVRLERELRQRLQCLTEAEIVLLARSTSNDRALLAWLAAVKQSSFLFDFAAETLRLKLEMHDPVLRSSDYDRFVEEKSALHPELSQLAESSSIKIRRVMLLMLKEAGILHEGSELGEIQRPVIPLTITKAIRADHPRWLAAFLVPENEINTPS